MMAAVLTTVCVFPLFAPALLAPAQAERVCKWVEKGNPPERDLLCEEKDPGSPGTPGDDGSERPKPACDLSGGGEFCRGTTACRYDEWHPPYVLPDGPKPSEDSEPVLVMCRVGPGWELDSIIWTNPGEPAEPPLADQARIAIGRLRLPVPVIGRNPVGRAYVNLPTGYWYELQSDATLRSDPPAFGMVAVATLHHLEVDPGDGSGTFTCAPAPTADPVTSAGPCRHTYTKASVGQPARTASGDPAYRMSMRAVWDLTFVDNGVEVTIPGVDRTLVSDPGVAAVAVGEIQARVIG